MIEYDKYFNYFHCANPYLKKKDEEIEAYKFQHILGAMKQTVIKVKGNVIPVTDREGP
jgi:hypothetical protein